MISFLNFIFPARLGRVNYVVRLLLTIFILPALLSPEEIEIAMDHPEKVVLSKWQAICLAFLVLYQLVYVAVPRLRDAGLRLWLMLLILIPIVSQIFTCLLALLPSRQLLPPESPDQSSE